MHRKPPKGPGALQFGILQQDISVSKRLMHHTWMGFKPTEAESRLLCSEHSTSKPPQLGLFMTCSVTIFFLFVTGFPYETFNFSFRNNFLQWKLLIYFQMSYSNETGAEYNMTQLRLNPTYIWSKYISYFIHLCLRNLGAGKLSVVSVSEWFAYSPFYHIAVHLPPSYQHKFPTNKVTNFLLSTLYYVMLSFPAHITQNIIYLLTYCLIANLNG